MGRLSEALAAEAPMKGPPCTMGVTLETLDDDDREALHAALADPARAHTEIARALRSVGLHMRAETVGRHRRGECGCG